ncbi:MAG: UDP-N-acetylmuramoyl-tripeptide--D-alanyl-D-alanine ligase [Alistipes sp.]|nr:UDP-N-acetylmuramoyl-tripeptide--D-alanyl-D-alanine ligase [Alistipes sp.]
MSAAVHIFTLAWLIYYAATMRYAVQMFQQNSYRTERYNRWLKQTGEWHSRMNSVAIMAAMLFAITSHSAALVIFGIWMVVIAIAEFSIRYKVRLAYTMRVKRLIVTRTLLTAAIIALVHIYAVEYTLVAMMLLTLDYWTIVANAINHPLEAAITRWYYNDAKRRLRAMPHLKVIGITGSFGKTSTKHFLHRILSERYNVLMTPGNFNTTLGVVRTIREHLKPHHEVFIVEMGAKQRGDIKEICDLVQPTMGIVTSVGEMHLETFGSVENIARTKFELVEAVGNSGLAVVNIDSVAAYNHIKQHGIKATTYGIENTEADYRASEVRYAPVETLFNLEHGGMVDGGYATHILGRGNILNITAALAIAYNLGITPEACRRAVRQIEQVEHRLSMRAGGGITILDDAYNSNPTGARMAVEVLAGFSTSGHRYVVTPGFVEMGAKQYDNNRTFGADIARANPDGVYVVNEVNREAIVAGLSEGGYAKEKIVCVASFKEAMAELQPRLKAGDVVLYENDLPDSFK